MGWKVYGSTRSRNAYKILLMLTLTGQPFEFDVIRTDQGGQFDPAFRAINPFGQVPVVIHDGVVLIQSSLILEHIAHATGKFMGRTGAEARRIREWLGFEQDMLFPGIGRVRFLTKIMKGDPAVVDHYRIFGRRALTVLEEALTGRSWLVGDGPTIADIGLYAYTSIAEEAGYDLDSMPASRAWLKRGEGLPGFETEQALLARLIPAA